MGEYMKCPFCGEDDFDLPGLKMHLLAWCEEFAKTEETSLFPLPAPPSTEGGGR